MTLTSYAQNFEDVMLWRALKHVKNGRYIDVGAQDPIIDSVSKNFHEQGWHGIHVEPVPSYATQLRQHRPNDLVLQAAVGIKSGTLKFYEFPDTGLSTTDMLIAKKHLKGGFEGREIIVPCITLDDVLSNFSGQDIHWLKIDVEGGEQKVLRSWTDSPSRPWIVVIESTRPLTQIESHKKWEPLLIAKGYKFAYFDGLNRFYISSSHNGLIEAFSVGPNLFDGFVLSRSSWPWGTELATQINNAEKQLEIERLQSTELLNQRETELAQKITAYEELRVRSSNAYATLQEALTARLLESQQATVDTVKALANTEDSLREKLSVSQAESLRVSQELLMKEREFATRLEKQELALRAELNNAKADALRINQLVNLKDGEINNLLQVHKEKLLELIESQASREREFATQHLEMLQLADMQKKEIADAHDSQVFLSKQEHAALKEIDAQTILALQQELQGMLRLAAKREQEFSAQLIAAQKIVDADKSTRQNKHEVQIHQLATEYASREHHLQEKLAGSQQEFRQASVQLIAQNDLHNETTRRLDKERDDCEKSFAELIRLAHHDHQFDRRSFEKNEQEMSARLMHATAQIEVEKATQKHLRDELCVVGSLLKQSLDDAKLLMDKMRIDADSEIQIRTDNEQRIQEKNRNLVSEISHMQSINQAQQIEMKKLMQNGEETVLFLKNELRIVADDLRTIQAQLNKDLADATSFKFNNDELQKNNAPKVMLNDLLEQSDSEFINHCFRKLLGRQPDLEAAQFYLQQLKKGISKKQIVSEIRVSDEGRRRRVTIVGFEELVPLLVPHATTVEELIAHEGVLFVHCAYKTIFNRLPDEEGLKFYSERLLTGVSKLAILSEMLDSDEAKGSVVSCVGLKKRIKQYRIVTQPYLGKLFKFFVDVEGDSAVEIKLRELERALAEQRIKSAEAQTGHHNIFSMVLTQLAGLTMKLSKLDLPDAKQPENLGQTTVTSLEHSLHESLPLVKSSNIDAALIKRTEDIFWKLMVAIASQNKINKEL